MNQRCAACVVIATLKLENLKAIHNSIDQKPCNIYSCNRYFKVRKSESNSQQSLFRWCRQGCCNRYFKVRKSESNSQPGVSGASGFSVVIATLKLENLKAIHNQERLAARYLMVVIATLKLENLKAIYNPFLRCRRLNML